MPDRWGEAYGDTLPSMVDASLYHADDFALAGDNYRIKDRSSSRSTVFTAQKAACGQLPAVIVAARRGSCSPCRRISRRLTEERILAGQPGWPTAVS